MAATAVTELDGVIKNSVRAAPVTEIPGSLTGMVSIPGNPGFPVVLSQDGLVTVVNTSKGAVVAPLLDLRPEITALLKAQPSKSKFLDERGLLGLAFHPEYAVDRSPYNGLFVVMYTVIANPALYPPQYRDLFRQAVPTPDHATVVALFSIRGGVVGNILAWPCPEFNHNGGGLAFGPDGCLWIGVGDGGGGGDKHGPLLNPADSDSYLGNAQNLSSPQGKLLRIRVLPDGSYQIPEDNPMFLTDALPGGGFGSRTSYRPALPEIAHWGFRNPWRMFFDGPDLYVADVGQDRFESIKLVQGLGHNYLWRAYEGFEVFNATVKDYIATEPGEQILPIIAYGREMGIATVGAGIYRGSHVPLLYGKLLIADYSGRVMIGSNVNDEWTISTLMKLEQRIHSLAFDQAGEAYLLTYNSESKQGQVLRLDSTPYLTDEDITGIGLQAVAGANYVLSSLRRDNGNPTTVRMHVAVIRRGDAEARLIASMEDAWAGSADIAKRKAYTAYAFSSNQNALTTRTIQALSQPTGAGLAPLFQIGNSNPEGGIIQFPGGIPLYKNGVLVGGIGVSGDGVDEDEVVAKAGATRYLAPKNIQADTVAGLPYLNK